MLSINEIASYYPENLRKFKRFLLHEYLQYKILEIIFDGPFANQLAFLGGTCLRIVHQNRRFSEDLDFDNFGLTQKQFLDIAKHIKNELERSGYQVETKQLTKGAFHCYIRFPRILFEQGLSGYEEEKILIQLDTEPQHFQFVPETVVINKFDVFTRIFTTPLDLLMAQKCYAILNRVRNKGRDFFDLVFLMGKGILPNLDYLQQKTGIDNANDLKLRLIKKCSTLNMNDMSRDVAPFLFDENDQKKVKLFVNYLEQFNFE